MIFYNYGLTYNILNGKSQAKPLILSHLHTNPYGSTLALRANCGPGFPTRTQFHRRFTSLSLPSPFLPKDFGDRGYTKCRHRKIT